MVFFDGENKSGMCAELPEQGENENECLEGNQKEGSNKGVAFMDTCQDVSGQLWKIKAINSK